MPKQPFEPCYSHGGVSEPRWPAVLGTGTGGGNPVDISGADPNNRPVMFIRISVGTATVRIQANGGTIDPNTGIPDVNDWIDVTGDLLMDFSDPTKLTYAKKLPPSMPYYRTRIAAIAGGNVISYVPLLVLPSGQVAAAHRPTIWSTQAT